MSLTLLSRSGDTGHTQEKVKFTKGNGSIPATGRNQQLIRTARMSIRGTRRSGDANLEMIFSRRPGHRVREPLSDWGSGKGRKGSGGQHQGVFWVMGLFCTPSVVLVTCTEVHRLALPPQKNNNFTV